MFNNVEKTAKILDSKLSKGDNIFFCRFGDGDLTLIAGAGQEQRHRNSAGLRRELHDSMKIDDPNYLIAHTVGTYGDGSGSYWWLKDRVAQNLDRQLKNIFKHLEIKGKDYYHALVFQYKFEHDPEWIKSFVKNYVKNKKVLFVAGELLCTDFVLDFFGVDDHIKVPGIADAYYNIHMPHIEKLYADCEIIIPTVGMASRVIAKRLWQLDNTKTLIDFGVMVDALARAPHRGWTQRMIREGIVERYK